MFAVPANFTGESIEAGRYGSCRAPQLLNIDAAGIGDLLSVIGTPHPGGRQSCGNQIQDPGLEPFGVARRQNSGGTLLAELDHHACEAGSRHCSRSGSLVVANRLGMGGLC